MLRAHIAAQSGKPDPSNHNLSQTEILFGLCSIGVMQNCVKIFNGKNVSILLSV